MTKGIRDRLKLALSKMLRHRIPWESAWKQIRLWVGPRKTRRLRSDDKKKARLFRPGFDYLTFCETLRRLVRHRRIIPLGLGVSNSLRLAAFAGFGFGL